jgi:hypothetical protein
MKKEWYSKLPWVGLISGGLMIILFVLAIILLPTVDPESTVNRKIASDKLKEIQIESNETLDSKTFADYLDKTLDVSVINTKWLINEDGEIIYANGMMAASTPVNTNIYSLVDNQNLGLIKAVEENIDSLQKKLLYVAAAIRSEGDHNDMIGHIVVPLKTSSDELAGFVGVAYDLDNTAQPLQFYIADIAMMISFLVYWLSFPLWVYFDCRKRNNKYILWTLFVLVGNLPAYIAYLITKK